MNQSTRNGKHKDFLSNNQKKLSVCLSACLCLCVCMCVDICINVKYIPTSFKRGQLLAVPYFTVYKSKINKAMY